MSDTAFLDGFLIKCAEEGVSETQALSLLKKVAAPPGPPGPGPTLADLSEQGKATRTGPTDS